MTNTPNTITVSIIDKIQPQNIPYDHYDNEVRLEYFMQMYQNLIGLVEIPSPPLDNSIPYRQNFLQGAADMAITAAADALVVLIDVLCEEIDKEKAVDGDNRADLPEGG